MEARAAATSRSAFSSQKRRSDESTRHIPFSRFFSIYRSYFLLNKLYNLFVTKDFLHIFVFKYFNARIIKLYLNTFLIIK